jgi:hypothetical protein
MNLGVIIHESQVLPLLIGKVRGHLCLLFLHTTRCSPGAGCLRDRVQQVVIASSV